MKKIYIAGKITDEPKYKEIFAKAEVKLKKEGYIVLNPSTLPTEMDYEDYMEICFAMIKQADEVYFLDNWVQSKGARRAVIVNELIIYLISISVILAMGVIAVVNLIMFIGKEKKN